MKASECRACHVVVTAGLGPGKPPAPRGPPHPEGFLLHDTRPLVLTAASYPGAPRLRGTGAGALGVPPTPRTSNFTEPVWVVSKAWKR